MNINQQKLLDSVLSQSVRWVRALRQMNKACRRKNKLIRRLRSENGCFDDAVKRNKELVDENLELHRMYLEAIQQKVELQTMYDENEELKRRNAQLEHLNLQNISNRMAS